MKIDHNYLKDWNWDILFLIATFKNINFSKSWKSRKFDFKSVVGNFKISIEIGFTIKMIWFLRPNKLEYWFNDCKVGRFVTFFKINIFFGKFEQSLFLCIFTALLGNPAFVPFCHQSKVLFCWLLITFDNFSISQLWKNCIFLVRLHNGKSWNSNEYISRNISRIIIAFLKRINFRSELQEKISIVNYFEKVIKVFGSLQESQKSSDSFALIKISSEIGKIEFFNFKRILLKSSEKKINWGL